MGDLHPDPHVARALHRAHARLQVGKWQDAQACSREALARDPGSALGRLQEALAAAMIAGRPADGSDVQERIERIPNFDRYRLRDGMLRATGDWTPLASLVHAMEMLVGFAVVDQFIVEYPKCGRTWLRMMVGRAIGLATGKSRADPGDLLAATRGQAAIPTTHVWHDDFPHLKPASMLVTDKAFYAGKRVLLLVRDPRDVVVSYFFQYTRRGDRTLARDPFDGSISEFLRHPRGSVDSIIGFYNAWARARAVPHAVLRITYEALRADTAGALRETLAFLRIPCPSEPVLCEIVGEFAFERMRQIERGGQAAGHQLRPGDVNDPESYKARRGKVGGYRDYLSEADIDWLDSRIANDLDDWYADYKQPISAAAP